MSRIYASTGVPRCCPVGTEDIPQSLSSGIEKSRPIGQHFRAILHLWPKVLRLCFHAAGCLSDRICPRLDTLRYTRRLFSGAVLSHTALIRVNFRDMPPLPKAILGPVFPRWGPTVPGQGHPTPGEPAQNSSVPDKREYAVVSLVTHICLNGCTKVLSCRD